ncbi:MAG: M24 family metallopeptidase [Phycisphaerales bacterium]|nr:M24 family metallopeptidase [Phycisphaerales bacterium]
MPVTNEQDLAAAVKSADCVVAVHRALVGYLRVGLTLSEIDSFVARTLVDLQCTSCFLGYKARGHPPFPSHACLSLNECVVHGTHLMSPAPLVRGDVLSVDIGVCHRGWLGDAAWTYAIGSADDVALSLMRSGRESLRLGVIAMRPGRPLVDFARAVQDHVERDCGYCLVRGLGGHGYGRVLHEPPFIANSVPSYPGEWEDAWKVLEPGMLLAVEPMIALSSTETIVRGKEWPIYTADNSTSVHYEADVLITPAGPRNLTQALFELPDIVGT